MCLEEGEKERPGCDPKLESKKGKGYAGKVLEEDLSRLFISFFRSLSILVSDDWSEPGQGVIIHCS